MKKRILLGTMICLSICLFGCKGGELEPAPMPSETILEEENTVSEKEPFSVTEKIEKEEEFVSEPAVQQTTILLEKDLNEMTIQDLLDDGAYFTECCKLSLHYRISLVSEDGLREYVVSSDEADDVIKENEWDFGDAVSMVHSQVFIMPENFEEQIKSCKINQLKITDYNVGPLNELINATLKEAVDTGYKIDCCTTSESEVSSSVLATLEKDGVSFLVVLEESSLDVAESSFLYSDEEEILKIFGQFKIISARYDL